MEQLYLIDVDLLHILNPGNLETRHFTYYDICTLLYKYFISKWGHGFCYKMFTDISFTIKVKILKYKLKIVHYIVEPSINWKLIYFQAPWLLKALCQLYENSYEETCV